jgi:hypothetical protein
MIVLVVCGCTKVASVTPLGEHPKTIFQSDWDGTWINKEQSVRIKVTDPQHGVLQVAWAEEKGGRFVLESYQIEMREAGPWTFGNFKNQESPASYLWGLVKNDQGQIIIWTPAPNYFKKQVQAGVLPGKVDKNGDVVLEKLTSEQLKAMMSEAQGVCFNWQAPIVFFRLGK